jgi:hypothetical protein
MEIFARYKPSINQIKALNRCRLYLKVITLSDITTADGSRLLISARRGNIITSRTSQLLWPAQGKPTRADWTVWTSFLAHLEINGKLSQPLGEWKNHSHQIWKKFADPLTGSEYDQTSDTPQSYSPIVRNSRSLW